MLSVQCSRSLESSKILCVPTVISSREIGENRLPENRNVANRPTGEVEHLTVLQVANRIEIQASAEGGQLERTYLLRRGGRPYMRRRRAIASTNRTRANASAAVHVRYDVRRTTPRRPTHPSRRRYSSSHRDRSDRCAAVAADDVPAVLQNDDHLDHPAGPRRRLSR